MKWKNLVVLRSPQRLAVASNSLLLGSRFLLLKKENHFYYFTNVPRKVHKIEPSATPTPKTKELFITWCILIQTVGREKEQLRIF